MQPVYVDTSAWYAIADQTDSDHPSAAATIKRLTKSNARLVTTGHILAELHRLVLHRSHRRAAVDAVRRIIATPRVDLIHADAEDLRAALGWIDRFEDQDFTLTDAIGFAAMDRLKIRRAFAYDHDFTVAGFDLVS